MRTALEALPGRLRRLADRARLRLSAYRPHLPEAIDLERIQAQAAGYFHLPPEEVGARFRAYQEFHHRKGYAQRLGEARTLSFEEAFLVFLSLERAQPQNVVEIGTQHGKSTRRILDMLALLGLPARVTCFDIRDELRFVSHEEVRLELRDVTGEFERAVLEPLQPAFLFLDARPYALLMEALTAWLRWSAGRRALLAVHDCSPGLYNARMFIPKDAPERISSRSGVWERHVLSEVFQAPQEALEDLRTPQHHLRIFPTRHGLALLGPHAVLEGEG